MLYNFGRLFFAVYLNLFYRLRIHGREHVPKRKPFIICSNHISLLDPMTIGAALPAAYRIHFMAKEELFRNTFLAYCLKKVGAFPVNRGNADYGAIKKSYRLLEEGQVLGLFPEGSRSKNGRLQKGQNGAALIAVRSGVPVLPVAIEGPYRLFQPLNVYIGTPFVLPALVYDRREDRKERLEDLTREIMSRIGRLLPA